MTAQTRLKKRYNPRKNGHVKILNDQKLRLLIELLHLNPHLFEYDHRFSKKKRIKSVMRLSLNTRLRVYKRLNIKVKK